MIFKIKEDLNVKKLFSHLFNITRELQAGEVVCFFKQYLVTTYLAHSHTCGLEVEHHHSMLHPKKKFTW